MRVTYLQNPVDRRPATKKYKLAVQLLPDIDYTTLVALKDFRRGTIKHRFAVEYDRYLIALCFYSEHLNSCLQVPNNKDLTHFIVRHLGLFYKNIPSDIYAATVPPVATPATAGYPSRTDNNFVIVTGTPPIGSV